MPTNGHQETDAADTASLDPPVDEIPIVAPQDVKILETADDIQV